MFPPLRVPLCASDPRKVENIQAGNPLPRTIRTPPRRHSGSAGAGRDERRTGRSIREPLGRHTALLRLIVLCCCRAPVRLGATARARAGQVGRSRAPLRTASRCIVAVSPYVGARHRRRVATDAFTPCPLSLLGTRPCAPASAASGSPRRSSTRSGTPHTSSGTSCAAACMRRRRSG